MVGELQRPTTTYLGRRHSLSYQNGTRNGTVHPTSLQPHYSHVPSVQFTFGSYQIASPGASCLSSPEHDGAQDEESASPRCRATVSTVPTTEAKDVDLSRVLPPLHSTHTSGSLAKRLPAPESETLLASDGRRSSVAFLLND